MLNYDLIIIGGGISGLYTALKYKSKSSNKTKNVLIIEKNARLGGRIFTLQGEYKNVKYGYEVGAARISNKHKNIIKLIKKYKLNLIKIPSNNDFVPIPSTVHNKYELKFKSTDEFILDLLKKIRSKPSSFKSNIKKLYIITTN